MALRTVGVRLTADVTSYMSRMKQAGTSTRDFAGEMSKAAKSGHLDAVADRAAFVGTALTGMAAYAVKSAADFDKSMSAVQAATHASAGEIDALRAAALQAGKDTQFSATGAADAITELSKAGVTTADVLNGGLKGALSLAAAGQLDVGEAAETAASAMTQFKLTGDKIPHVADLLAAAAGKAQGSVHDMGYALNQSGLVASQFGLSIEDTTGVLAEFANAGLIGSDAGTSFKTMLLAIANPSSTTAKLMQNLGIEFYDTQGRFVGLSGVAEVLQQRLGTLTEQQRQQALGQLFGNDAIRAGSILYRDGAAGVEDWKNKVNEAGYASETAAKLTDNLAGDLERLKGSVETLAIEAGSGANGGLRTLVKAVEGLVDAIGSLPPFVTNTATLLAGLGGGALLLAAGWVKTRRASADFRAELEAMGPAGEKAASGLHKVSSVATKLGLVFAALQVAGAVINSFQKDLNPQVEAMAVGLEKYATGGALAGEASRVLGDNLDDLKVGFSFLADEDNSRRAAVKHIQDAFEGLIPGLDGTSTSLTKTRERIGSMDAALAQLASSGNASQAQQIFQKLAGELATGGVTMEEFRKQFPQYAASLEVAGKATGKAAGATGDLTDALNSGKAAQDDYKTVAASTAGVIRGESDAMIALSDQLQKAVDPAFAFISAQQDMAKAQKEATKAVKDHGKKSDEAREANRKLAEAAITLQGAAGKVASTFNGDLNDSLKATLKAGGLTAAQIKDIEKQLKTAKTAADKYDDDYAARLSAPGATKAKKDIDKAQDAAAFFEGPYIARLSVDGVTAVNAKLDALLVKQRALQTGLSVPAARAAVQKDLDRNRQKAYASGGWTGPGGTHDPAGVVHADEFVIKKSSRRKIEAQAPGMLEEMNATGQAPGYASGGRVGDWPFKTTASKTRIPSWEEVASKVGGNFGDWPSSPGAQRGDSGVWRKIVALVKGSGIPYDFGNGYRPGDPLWHGSGRAVDFMGYNQDRLAQFFMARQHSVLELIHRSKNRDYGLTRGHYNAMPHQWPLHRNHLHVAMKNGGTINEPIQGVGASGRTYSFGENYQPERVVPNWSPAGGGSGGGQITNVYINNQFAAGANLREAGRQQAQQLSAFLNGGGKIVLTNGTQVLP